jgi:phage terminase small subunit
MSTASLQRRYVTKLNAREEAFAQHYVLHHDVMKAFIHAGFRKEIEPAEAYQRGIKLLAKPSISIRIKELQDAVAEKEGISIQAVVANFVQIFEKAMSAAKPDFTNANRAMENLSKYLGMEVNRSETTQKIIMGKEDEESIDRQIKHFADVVGLDIVMTRKSKDEETVH